MESKKYLEIIGENALGDVENIQYKVKDKVEAVSKFNSLDDSQFLFKKYVARYHICRHGENGKNHPCEIEILKEVK